jgi:ATP-dependent helicase HepA
MSLQNKTFVPGQCWSSEAEPELGVGFVRGSDPQTVTLEFPLVGEMRRYGRRSAPLKRLEFREGDTVQAKAGPGLKVAKIEERDGLFWYLGDSKELCETQLSPKLRLHRPLQRFLAGHWDPLESFILRQRTLILSSRQAASPSRGMIGPRARLLPHQLYVADQIAARALPRALLADEVGLGKTIEAGWILHRLLVSGRARRVLIIVPPALVNQWFVELLRRFYLSFWVPSSQSEEAMTAEDFREQERLILGTDALSDPTVVEGILGSHWDLVIVDEAHRLGSSGNDSSPEYQVLETLAKKSPGLLLLTATPEQLGLEGHFARLHLVDPARFASWEDFQAENTKYREVVAQADTLLAQKGRAAALELIDQFGTGRVYFRNSRRIVEQEHCAFPKRILCEHPLPLAIQAKKGTKEAARETLKESEEAFVRWLGQFATAHKKDKTLLICATAERATELEKRLREEYAVKAVAFHEGMPLLARDRNAAYFEDSEGATILLSSEIGGEGRNFQHACHLILTDLPADPDVLEQRIGRLDRIGGASEIRIHVPFVEGSREESLLRWHSTVFGAFEAPTQGASAVYQRHLGEFEKLLESGSHDLEAFLRKARKDYRETLKEVEEGRDRLIELHSFDPEAATALTESISLAEKPEVLRDYLEVVFDSLGLHVDDLDPQTMFVEAGDSAFASYVPALPADGMRFTFSREKAVARDDLALMSWDHPLVTGMMDALASQEFGNTAVAAWTSELGKLPLAVECHFVFETSCDPKWNLPEFFAPTPVRVVLDGPGNDLTDQWSFTALQEAISPLPPGMEAMAKRLPPDGLRKLLGKARDQADVTGEGVREISLSRMNSAIDSELQRLEALRTRNKMVSERELSWWKDRRRVLNDAILGSRVRLDSFLVVLPRSLGGR